MFSEHHQQRLVQGLRTLAFVASLFLLVHVVAGIKGLGFIGEDGIPENTISVSGDGEVFAVPDIATFTFGATHEALTVAEAERAVSEKISSALAFLQENGIAEKDTKTTDYSIYPRYEYPEIRCITFPCPTGERKLVGYEVSQNISVTVRAIDEVGKLVGGLGEIGVTNVSGLVFSIEDEDAVVREARKMAIDEARIKAKELAKDLGVRLRRIVGFSEGGGGVIYPAYRALEAKGGDMAVSEPEIPAGENKVTSLVTITYEIR